jgi:HEAT repeat protein
MLGHGAWTRLYHRWSGPHLAYARNLIYNTDAEPVDAVIVSAVRALPFRLRVRLLAELVHSAAESKREDIEVLAREAGVVRHAERMAHSRWWWRRLRGARLLTLFGGNEILVLSLLRDAHAAVRAQGAELAATHPTPAVIHALLERLEDGAALPRFAAQDALLRLGPLAHTALAAYLEQGTGNGKAAALAVAIGMADPAFTRSAVRMSDDADPAVRARAIELLGAIGTLDGVDAATRRLDDATAPVRAAAARALGRIGHWPAAPAIALLLRDRTWEVRHAAGLALRELGSPGALLLRRTRQDDNLFAADMARRVLDLPGAAGAVT